MMFNFALLFLPTWSHFGTKNSSKSHPKSIQNWYRISYRFFHRFLTHFPSIWGANLGAFSRFWGKKRRAPKNVLRSSTLFFKFFPSQTPLRPLLGPFWDRCGNILGPFWDRFGRFLTHQPPNPPTNQPTNTPTTQPTRQPPDQPTTPPTNQPANQPPNHPTNQPTKHRKAFR